MIAFILIQWRYFSKGLFVFSFIANVRLMKSDETWFKIIQYRIKLSSAISSDLADLVQVSILITLMFSQSGAKESNQDKINYHIKVPPTPSYVNLSCFINHKILNLGHDQYLIIDVEY